MDLIATPKNPIPLGASTGYIDVRKGLRLRFASWQPVLRERRGTVCIFPGRAEFIEKYFEVVGELRRRGFAVAVLDWRGQGGSSRLTRSPLKGHVNDFAEYEEDLSHFMKAVVLPDCPAPYFALAHSMSAMVLFSAATKRGCWFSRMVMTAPMVRIAGLPMPEQFCRQLADGLTMFGFGKRPVPGDTARFRQDQEFEGNTLTSDRERFMRSLSVLEAAPELAIEAPTVGWLKAALEAVQRVGSEKFAPRIRVPVLMLAAGDDQIVDSKAVEGLAARLRAGSQIVLRGARHEILQERDSIREQFWAAFDAFVPGVALSKAS
jgi:lysophospholipase